MIDRKKSRDLVFINTLVKKLEWKKYYRKNGTWTHNVLSIEFLEYLIGFNSKTTPPRVKILPPVNFVGSNYPNKKFSSRNSKFSNFDTLAFFLPLHTELFFNLPMSTRKKSFFFQIFVFFWIFGVLDGGLNRGLIGWFGIFVKLRIFIWGIGI